MYMFSKSVGYLASTEQTVYMFQDHFVIKDGNCAKIVDNEKIVFWDEEPETTYYNNYQTVQDAK